MAGNGSKILSFLETAAVVEHLEILNGGNMADERFCFSSRDSIAKSMEILISKWRCPRTVTGILRRNMFNNRGDIVCQVGHRANIESIR